MMGGHPSAGHGVSMMGGSVVGMQMMGGLGMAGMAPMMGPYPGQPMDGMAMMHPMAAPFQQGGGQVPSYVAAYQGQGLGEPPTQPNGAGGWASDGTGAAGFGGHEQAVGEYAHRGSEQGVFSQLHMGGHCGCGGSGGGGSFGSGGVGMGLLERQMSAASISSDDGRGGGQNWDRLYVTNLPRSFSEHDVHRLFAPYGSLVDVMPNKRGDGGPKGSFFISFASAAEGQNAARNLHNYVLPNAAKPLTVRPSNSRRRADSRGGAPNGLSSYGAPHGYAPHGGADGGLQQFSAGGLGGGMGGMVGMGGEEAISG